MAGIYIHIPFCKKICSYCDFHKSASFKNKTEILEGIATELAYRKDYLEDEEINTIYFGGGTPSVLSDVEINRILNSIHDLHPVSEKPEINFEANPDDLSKAYLDKLLKTGVNRLSVGCQSFTDEDLMLLDRRHNAKQSYNSVMNAKSAGFSNISIDLIYGIPGMKNWPETLIKVLDLRVQHISAYHLSIEEKTLLHKLRQKGSFKELDESVSNQQYRELIEFADKNQFVQYEISSFGKKGCFSKHNSNYWKQEKYLGLGPSAHSYNGNSRQWNVSNNKKYIQEINNGKIPFVKEILNPLDHYNDYVLVSLRTMWGVDLEYVENTFSKELKDYCNTSANKFVEYGLLRIENNHIYLTNQGKFVSDNIISELLYVA
ncbi:MAG: radical SAM family heme chaperone HemW [Bacteroidota bacterium]|nr:radical SAM family heme chaperone HemW [Bacteroidota bacterium]